MAISNNAIMGWLDYWAAAKFGANVQLIETRDDVTIARRFCPQLTRGVMTGVSDDQFWAAVSEWRKERAHAAQCKAAAMAVVAKRSQVAA